MLLLILSECGEGGTRGLCVKQCNCGCFPSGEHCLPCHLCRDFTCGHLIECQGMITIDQNIPLFLNCDDESDQTAYYLKARNWVLFIFAPWNVQMNPRFVSLIFKQFVSGIWLYLNMLLRVLKIKLFLWKLFMEG